MAKKELFVKGIPSSSFSYGGMPIFVPPVELDEEVMKEGFLDTPKDFVFGAGQGASYNLLDEGIGRVKSITDPTKTYEQHRDEVRDDWQEARNRSPIATIAGEVTGAIVSPTSKITAFGKGVKGVLRAGAEGAGQSYGASDKEDLKGQAVDSAEGALIGVGTGAIMNGLTKTFSKSPNAVRSEAMGVKPKDYRVEGPGDRKQIVERINATGMLKNRKLEYDVDQMKFVTKNKSKFQIDELEKNTEERLLNRAQDAVKKLQVKKEKDFGPILDSRFVSIQNVDQMADEIAQEFGKRGLMKGVMDRNKAAAKIRENILDQLMVNGQGSTQSFSLREMDMLKKMSQEDVKNFSKSLSELGDNEELARITARKLKQLVEDGVNDQKFGKLNSAQHDFLTVSDDLKNKIRSLELAAPATENVNKTSLLERGIDGLSGGSQGRLDRAATKEWYENAIPKPVRAVIPYAAEEAPGAIFRQRFEGQSPSGNWRNPSGVENIPEELIRTPLPRNTQSLMEKKSFVLAKVAQMMPEMYEAVKDTFDHEPERLGEVAQVLSQKMPHVFERDKYNRYDGRIISEKDKALAIKDTMLRKDISSIEQSKIITKLNQTGEFE